MNISGNGEPPTKTRCVNTIRTIGGGARKRSYRSNRGNRSDHENHIRRGATFPKH